MARRAWKRDKGDKGDKGDKVEEGRIFLLTYNPAIGIVNHTN